MITVDQRIAFAEKHYTDRDGRPFDISDRQWVRDHLFLPVFGFKLWPNSKKLCKDCRQRAGTLVESYHAARETQTEQHAQEHNCKGLRCEPNIITVCCLNRQEGKTFNSSALVLGHLMLERARVMFITASESQTKTIVADNYLAPINANPLLRRRVKQIANKLYIPHKVGSSSFEAVRSSHSSITGRSNQTLLVLDECRDIRSRTALALLPSIFSSRGWRSECGFEVDDINKKADDCPQCGDLLEPWFGRILITSSAGVDEGGSHEKDWFRELVEHLSNNPDPNATLYRRDQRLNPNENTPATQSVERIFGALESTRHYASIEVSNTFSQRGDSYLAIHEVNSCLDQALTNKLQSDRPCFAFLDTSISNDLSSLVIVAEDESSLTHWEHVRLEHLKVWDPKDSGGTINDEEIFEYLCDYVPRFPALLNLLVDTRGGMAWAVRLVHKAKQTQPWARVINPYNGGRADHLAMWNVLEQRARSGSLRWFKGTPLEKELAGLKRITLPDGTGASQVVDRDRRKVHADVASGLAVCLLMIHRAQTETRTSLLQISEQAAAANIMNKLHRSTGAKFDFDDF